MKKLVLKVCEEVDKYSEIIYLQAIEDKENGINFSVCDLSGCPEDAVIGRDLFQACDYIDALNKGIELAQKGYTRVVGEWEDEKEEGTDE